MALAFSSRTSDPRKMIRLARRDEYTLSVMPRPAPEGPAIRMSFRVSVTPLTYRHSRLTQALGAVFARGVSPDSTIAAG